jgi:UPF0042 nucleotide-binding protein
MNGEPRIAIVSGLSGSGKSTAMAALEDLGFYCVDNLPVPLIEQLLAQCAQSEPAITRIALALHAREGQFLRSVPGVVASLRERGADVAVIFLDCANDVLVRRYRETRRVHPLAPGGTVEEGIEAERRLLVEVAGLADHAIDTSSLNVHQLVADVVRRVSGETRSTVVNIESFGFRHATPAAAELLFDVRFLPNPFFEAHLRPLSGLDGGVSKYVLESPQGAELVERLCDLLQFLLPLYDAEGKAYLTIGVGCTGGRHRSVAIAERLAADLRDRGREVNVEHRDAERK